MMIKISLTLISMIIALQLSHLRRWLSNKQVWLPHHDERRYLPWAVVISLLVLWSFALHLIEKWLKV